MHLSKNYSSTKKWLWFLVALCLLGLWSWSTIPRSEAAVELISFTATATNNNSEVQLRWETAVEMDTAGYRFKRTNNNSEFISVIYLGEETNLIPGDATGLGAIYIAQDTAVTTGNTYIYTLVEIDNSGGQEEIASAVVNLGNSQPTNTPSPTATATNSVSLPATNTPTVAVQASPTATNTPTIQANPTATSTPIPQTNSAATSTPAPATNNNTSNSSTGSPGSDNNTNSNNNPTTTTGNSNSGANTTNNTNSSSGASVAEAGEAQQSPEQQEGEEGEAYPVEDSSEINDEAPAQDEDEAEDETTAVSTAYPATIPNPATTPNENENQAVDPTGYQGNESESSTSPSQIGINPNDNSDNTSPENSENQASNNNLILWGAFLAAIVVFVAGIAGSLLLFMRRR